MIQSQFHLSVLEWWICTLTFWLWIRRMYLSLSHYQQYLLQEICWCRNTNRTPFPITWSWDFFVDALQTCSLWFGYGSNMYFLFSCIAFLIESQHSDFEQWIQCRCGHDNFTVSQVFKFFFQSNLYLHRLFRIASWPRSLFKLVTMIFEVVYGQNQ